MTLNNILAIFLSSLLFLLTMMVVHSGKKKQHFDVVRFIARVGIFAALSSILYIIPIFKIKLPFFPSFLELHFDEVPALICGFAYGPLAGFAVIFVKTIIKLPFTTTICVGEITDFVVSSLYVLPACFIYSKKRNLGGVFIGFTISTIIQLLGAMVVNVYVAIPFYETVMGLSEESLLYVVNLAMPKVKNLSWSYAFIAVLPFNILKDAIVFIFTFLIYRKIHFLLQYEGRTGLKINK